MSSETTPNRKTFVLFNPPEAVTSEPQHAHMRSGGEICRGGLGSNNSSNMDRLATGGLLIAPYQKVLTTQTEQNDVASTIIPLSRFQTIPGYVERNHYAGPNFLSGVVLQPATQTSGFPMSEKTVPAGQAGGWAQTLQPIVDAVASFIPTNRLAQYDCHAVSLDTFDENEGFTWRFRTPPGHQYTAMQIAFHFGGPVNANKNGKYSLAAAGKFLYLAEFSQRAKDVGGTGWVQVDKWQYALANNPGEIVTITILPYRTTTGNLFIEFEADTQSEPANAGNNQLNQQIRTVGPSNTKHIFNIDTSANSPTYAPGMPTRMNATGAGTIRIDMARELRMPWQISVLRYLPTAWFEDFPVVLQWNISTRANLILYSTADVPAGTTLTVRLMDATTRVELTAVSSGAGYTVYRVNPGQPAYYVRGEFTTNSSQKKTPVLYKYSIQRDAWITSTPDLSFTAFAQGINTSGPEADPSHETASLVIKDFTDSLSILRTRAAHRVRIYTQYDPAHLDKISVLFDGYSDKIKGRRRGKKSGAGASGTGAGAYPAAKWTDYNAAFLGMWTRLHKTLTMFRLDLQQQDPLVGPNPDGTPQPFKVSDICRSLLGYAGFTSGQIDVPDSPIRFYPGGSENGQSLMIDPLSNVAEAVVKFLKEYLAWFLIWDGNAGTQGGMWRARPQVPTFGPYTNLARFTLDRQAAGKVAHFSESWNGDTHGKAWVGDLTHIPTVPIMEDFEPYPIWPEGNAVCVTATGNYLPQSDGQFALTNWLVNPNSYNCFADAGGATIVTADPTHPDYLGFFAPIIVVNLGIGDKDGKGQQVVDTICRRVYDVSCHGTEIIPFVAPLCLVVDPNDTKQTNPRPLRYYDPVLVVDDGVEYQCLVRNCNPAYRKDSKQMAYYELFKPYLD